MADLTRHLPGPFASRELLRLGARVVRIESPKGDPVRDVAPDWDARLNAGKESVLWDADADRELGAALCRRADVVLEGFRPGVAARLGVGPDDVPERTVYCSITGFGDDDARAGHDLNYLGWAGALETTAPAMPPLPIADLAVALTVVARILGALLERARTGRGARIVVSMTHEAHELAYYSRPLTGELACYRIYECADGRFVTVAALEPKFWARLCELVNRPDLIALRHDCHAELEALFRTRPAAEWLELLASEDAMVGPVATLEEAAMEFAQTPSKRKPPALGQHTEAWREALRGSDPLKGPDPLVR